MTSPSGPEEWAQVEAAFDAARELDPRERAAWLDRAGLAPALRAAVERLLEDVTRAQAFLEPPLSIPVLDPGPDGELPGELGRYRLVRFLAGGGTSYVYEAEQDAPRRRVAIKVLRRGLDSTEAVARFRMEAEILARLRHPGIGQVLEADVQRFDDPAFGSREVPYLVMEFVEGARPITEHAERASLTVRERFELFAAVCEAVDHGHRRGVVHRDLKPANVLVGTDGRPKVIDFGIARVSGGDLTVSTMHTATGDFLGTVRYMSPEQCSGLPADVEAPSDVYSLGLILHELLTGELPYDVPDTSPLAAAVAICEARPQRLSRANPALRGDADILAAKALARDPEARYGSAGELARDVRNLLARRPLFARAPSLAYNLRTFVRRHRALSAALAGALLSLLVGAIAATAGWIEASRQGVLAKESAEEAEDASRRMRAERDGAEAVTGFLTDALLAGDPFEVGGGTMESFLDRVRTSVESGDQAPLVEARLRDAIGMSFVNLRRLDDAEQELRRAAEIRAELLPADDPARGRSALHLAYLFLSQGDLAGAETVLDDARRFLAQQETVHPIDTAELLAMEGGLLVDSGRVHEGLQKLEAARASSRERGQEGDYAAYTMTQVSVEMLAGNTERAEELTRECLAIYGRTVGERHGRYANALSSLCAVLTQKGELQEAEEAGTRAVELSMELFSDGHTVTATAMSNLAGVLIRRGEYVEAEAYLRDALRIDRSLYGDTHDAVADDLMELGRVLAATRGAEESLDLFFESLAVRKEVYSEDHPKLGSNYYTIGQVLTELGHYAEAEEALLEAHRLSTGYVPHELRDGIARSIVRCYEAWGRGDQAEAWRAKLAE